MEGITESLVLSTDGKGEGKVEAGCSKTFKTFGSRLQLYYTCNSTCFGIMTRKFQKINSVTIKNLHNKVVIKEKVY